MTSFVTTATTMFSRFPLRHSKPKEPEIGFPILVESSRPDVLLMRSENHQNILSQSSFTGTLKYTTTPNFNAHPIMPASNGPPTFHTIPRHPAHLASLPSTKKSAFTRKPVASAPSSAITGPKSIDLLFAAEASRRGSSPDEVTRKESVDSVALEPKTDIPPPPPEKAPRLRDSIVPSLSALDRSFLGSICGGEDIKEEDEESASDPPTPVPSTTPIPSNSTSSRLPLPQARKVSYEPEPLKVLPKTNSGPPPRRSPPPILSPTGAPMIELAPLTPILQDNGDDTSSVLMSLVSESGNSSPQEPKGGEAYIALLERQRDQLIARQRRVMHQIKELEACLPPNPSTHNYTHRAQLKDELKRLQAEYDSLSRDLYDKGLMLHRAWKRRDANMGLEAPAVLWVRRVGGP
ncbi:hypothetical protein TWF569_010971 [Orbilia oligospora]|uniref:Uncharacterized protein n=1 Tax=Orbilia oligospora TaxID=2813651 RepID=A0A7C8NDR5_ORBOL|nr:hypothetical protein TWF706_001540 [Orbilia oligospora]KAF3083011.1 hypothetical protein TWF103_003059 [Orbilia oligospora]KAF3101972.1 hypothetical protein TWF102_004708 [Orbilia oligospora]KAF3120357.1 hypothetical protein TWF594_003916 [Orbilia oligospora]KAF3125864.1 hypothetical protein TWF703_010684 [Orbilia oligospora]